jgi:major vault protein
MAELGRTGDLVLSQGTYVLLQDGATGSVEVVTGPFKISLADTEKPVVYEKESRRFAIAPADKAIRVCPAADEGQYIVLSNPTADGEGKVHPSKGKQSTVQLLNGKRINIQGPDVFALYPGQIAEVIDGHQIKSNEYLLTRVYNEKAAKENLKNAVVKGAEGEPAKPGTLFDDKDIRTGNLLIIKGTVVSFYIPPTGIEVLQENGSYVRNAVTLERLEYCVLLDQNGDKRYVKGPDVVFPKPTETFIESNGKNTFRAIELNENMGIYIKVIADYVEDEDKNAKKRIAGEELFITGKEQKIYFPRPEHAVIKYGTDTIHYATAVPAGEGRYILDKNTGEVKLTVGPKMLLPDPRSEVIVKRVLSDKLVSLWFPGNQEALKYNQQLKATLGNNEGDYVEEKSRSFSGTLSKSSNVAYAALSNFSADEMTRKLDYTKPRTIKLDTKYEGAVLLNIWPNFAVQIVNKTGDRRVVEGPKVIMLAYDETLEVLELSTGKPKTDHNRMATTYLQTKNNVVSDIIEVETKDMVSLNVRLSYKVNFDGDSKIWFNVSDYVKLLCQHTRSLIRNAVKKITIEEFSDKSADVIRDNILGVATEKTNGKRPGRSFEENGMKIYDVEVLNLDIDDEDIAEMLQQNQHDIVENNLKLVQLNKELEFTKKTEDISRQKLDEKIKTNNKEKEVELIKVNNYNSVEKQKIENQVALETLKLDSEQGMQETIDLITTAKRTRDELRARLQLEFAEATSAIKVKEVKEQMAAIQPGLIEALVSVNDVNLAKILAENLKEQKGGSGFLESLLGGGGFESFMKTIKGTSLEGRINSIMTDFAKMKEAEKTKK